MSILITAGIAIVGGVALFDRAAGALAHGAWAQRVPARAHHIVQYLEVRDAVLPFWPVILLLLIVLGVLVYRGLRAAAAATSRARERIAGFAFRAESSALGRVEYSLKEALLANPDPGSQVFLGKDDRGRPIYLTNRARSMHLHVLGQTGSGKTKSVIEPLVLQDLVAGRGVLVVDGKGSEDNQERFIAMAELAGRRHGIKIFTLNPKGRTHTYNPVHLVPGADPRAVAERVFSSFVDDMDNPYYRDQARCFFVSLVCVLASTRQRFCMRDLAAAIASKDVLQKALDLASDDVSKAEIRAQIDRLGDKAGETLTGLLAAVKRYDHPALNAYDPDIVLEDELDENGAVAFFLPVNYYKQLARYVGLCVFQHVQQIGALRQLDRQRPQAPVFVYADEFYSFAYEGFTDAVNKLRDANISMLLSHQSFSDLEKISPEYARGIWDNTRNKIVLYQNDPDLCERLAKALGTEKGVELTVRRSADSFLNSVSTLEASSRQVDSYRCHPNRIKALGCGQAYLLRDSEFVGVNLRTIPERLFARLGQLGAPPPKTPQVGGIGLHELFVAKMAEAPEEKKRDVG
jgi:type IV secretory pathway TraG/TraD family ATPase VirD4